MVLYLVIREREKERVDVLVSVLSSLLGLKFSGEKVVPLSAFINPELVSRLLSEETLSSGELHLSEEEVLSILESEEQD